MTDYEKMQSIIDEIDSLIEANISSEDVGFQAWKTKTERFLVKKYGKDSLEHDKFINTHFSLLVYPMGTPNSEFVKACKTGLQKTKAIFQVYLDEIEEDSIFEEMSESIGNYSKVFIVHGHDGELKQAVARVVEKQKIEAIILSEQVNRGRTIIEKFEDYSDVDGAICLFTADDFGKAKKQTSDTPRARQNVIFETGFFMGKLGRDKLVILSEENVEIPSDLSGVVYTNTNNWDLELLKELKGIGYKVDLNKLI